MSSTFKAVTIILLIIIASFSWSHSIGPIRLAVFDNPKPDTLEPKASQELKEAYIKGIKTGIYAAKLQGISIRQKNFFYGHNLLHIFQMVPKVKQWQPDLVIGLHSSNEALMARTFFKKPLVLSITATDPKLFNKKIKNLYSLSVCDKYGDRKLVHFISKKFPDKNLFVISGVKSKESVDSVNLIEKLFKDKFPHKKIKQRQFLINNILDTPPNKLLKGYDSNDIILLSSIAGTYSAQIKLMQKINRYLSPQKPIFISTVDNWGQKTIPGTASKGHKNDITAYRINNLYADRDSLPYRQFKQYYQALYKQKPKYHISYITYKGIMSVITALKKFPPDKNLDARGAILQSFQKATKSHPNWFRPMTLALYKINPPYEQFCRTLS